jgi:membrane-bound ClpP family serine protease
MKEYLLPAILQVIGVIVAFIEVFIPSFGILAAIAFGLFSYSLYLIFTNISDTAGMVVVILDIILVPVLVFVWLKMLAKSPLALKKELNKQQGVVSQAKELESYIQMEGIAVTDLRPAGIAEINMKRLDVVTDGEYIEANTAVVVREVSGNRVVVSKT